MERQKLNVDVPRAITDFEEAAKEFELKEKLYRIIFRGKGLEFDRYRDYSQDEDATNIDWKASMRAQKLIAKQYIEERDLKVIFAIDVSENMLLGSSEKLKCEYAAELVIALSNLILNSNDRVGFVLYSDKIVEYIPPKRGNNHFFLLSDKLSDSKIYGGGSNTGVVLDFLLDYLGESIDSVFIVSDFIKVNKSHLKKFYLVAHKFETMAIMVKDLIDKTFPDLDREVVIEDPVTREQILINPKKVKEIYEKNSLEQEKIVREVMKEGDIDFLELTTDKAFAFRLAGFLSERINLRRMAI